MFGILTSLLKNKLSDLNYEFAQRKRFRLNYFDPIFRLNVFVYIFFQIIFLIEYIPTKKKNLLKKNFS